MENDFWNSVNEGAKEERSGRIGNLPRTGMEADTTNYEILPIQELRKKAALLHIPDIEKYNKQELIEQIHLKKRRK